MTAVGIVGSWPSGLTPMVVTVGIGMGLLLAAAWNDLRTRLIPDTICLVLALLGLFYRAQFGLIDFAFSIIMSLLLFFLLFAAFNRGVVGGGDVKLMVATGLWLSPPDCYMFLVVTALVGGLLALLYLVARFLPLGMTAEGGRGIRWSGSTMNDVSALAARDDAVRRAGEHVSPASGWLGAELARMRSGEAMPYGVAIAAGGCYVLLMSLRG